MKICIISHEYPPFPGGGIATYHAAAAKYLAEAGHEIHVVSNGAAWGTQDTQARRTSGNLTVHRVELFDEGYEPPADARLFDADPREYWDTGRLWAIESSSFAAHRIAAFVEKLHEEIGLDVIETPEFFAEAFYIIRRRRSGDADKFPPVCVHGHTSSRFAFGTNQHTWDLGYQPHRQRILREEYCVQHADALITPSCSLMRMYEQRFADALPAVRDVMPYFLELPTKVGEPPAEVARGRSLVCIGRIEPRKGSDLVLRVFAKLAADHDDLQLVFLGKQIWHQGEDFSDVIDALVPAAYHDRIFRLGNVPREQALAAARAATAVVHAAPWDNYPCAILEALAVGAACVVSDSGGHAEMIEHEKSGLVFPAGDAGALERELRRVLDDPGLKARLAGGAQPRVAELTDTARLVERKLETFTKMIEADRARAAASSGARTGGLIVLDAGSADASSIQTTAESLARETRGSSWQVAVLVDPHQTIELAEDWAQFNVHEPFPWLAAADDDLVVWVRAGVRLDAGVLDRICAQHESAVDDCGSYVWLRPASSYVFPYRPDFGVHDALVGGLAVPPVFAVRAARLRKCRDLAGLFRPEHRNAALCAAAAATGMTMRHIGVVGGEFDRELPFLYDDVLIRTVGYLERLGGVDAQAGAFGTIVPDAPPSHPSAENGRLEELERVFREHEALKRTKVVRVLRRLGLLSFARRLLSGERQSASGKPSTRR